MNDSHKLGIADLRSAYARGALAPRAHVEQMFARIDRLNPRLNAYLSVDRDAALAAADESGERYRSDRQRPLEGVTIAVKANIAVAGLELNAGMAARSGMIAETDAAIVKKLRDAGAIILGTLNMHEAALGTTTDNRFFGRCLNPHGEGRTPGGSSGGSGAAVAAGLCVAALGTDTLGSVRIPAAYCGVFGLKPTLGAVPDDGLVPLSGRFDAIGPLARSMDDIASLTNVIVAPDLSMAMQRVHPIVLDRLGDVEPEADVADAYKFALALLGQDCGTLSLASACGRIRVGAFAATARDLAAHLVELGPQRCARISDETGALIDFGLSRSAVDLQIDEALISETANAVREAIGTNGILLTPTCPQTAFAHGGKAPTNQADWTMLANVAGLPAISIPIGRDAQLMPIGLQLIGPPGGEALLIAQARAINDRAKAYAPPVNWW